MRRCRWWIGCHRWVLMSSVFGDTHREDATGAGRALQRDRAVHGLHETGDDPQAQARPCAAGRVGRHRELLEDRPLIRERDASAIVFDLDSPAALIGRQPDRDLVGLGMLERVEQQVVDHLLEGDRVDGVHRGEGNAVVRGADHAHPDAARVGVLLQAVHQRDHQRRDVAEAARQRIGDAGRCEQFHQHRHAFRIALERELGTANAVGGFLRMAPLRGGARQCQVQRQRMQRVAQLVRSQRQDVVAQCDLALQAFKLRSVGAVLCGLRRRGSQGVVVHVDWLALAGLGAAS